VSQPLPAMPRRPVDGHKGTFGTVCVLGGQCAQQAASPRVMIGGPAYAATSALRAGAGLAVLAMPEPILAHGLTIAPSATGLALPVDGEQQLRPSAVAAVVDEFISTFDCIALGPGLGADEAQQQVVLRLVGQDGVPLVIDADALNCLAATTDFDRDVRASCVLTPHPGEYRRLAQRLDLSANATEPDAREDAAAQLARRVGCVVVLKGHHTVISDGINTTVEPSGNVALATAGTGDVLTGVIASMIAQFNGRRRAELSVFDCARLGVRMHGLAADSWAERHGDAGLLASELPKLLPAARGKMT